MSTSETYTTVRVERTLMPAIKLWALRHNITISDAITQLCSAGLQSVPISGVRTGDTDRPPVSSKAADTRPGAYSMVNHNHIAARAPGEGPQPVAKVDETAAALGQLATAVELLKETLQDVQRASANRELGRAPTLASQPAAGSGLRAKAGTVRTGTGG
jgi:hypothetical protein